MSPVPLPDAPFARSLLTSPPSPSQVILSTITHLSLLPHPEGGHYAETDRCNLLIPNPFNTPTNPPGPGADQNSVRNASTTIYYLLSPGSPLGHFHRNKARTVHTLHRGRGRYVLIHPQPHSAPPRTETFVVGQDLSKGEKLQWIVEGGVWKASYLLPDKEDGEESKGGLLISETVVPGFEFRDHEFLSGEGLRALLGEGAEGWEWLVRRERAERE
jgi:predicted cupin superfamily sugar epimerase